MLDFRKIKIIFLEPARNRNKRNNMMLSYISRIRNKIIPITFAVITLLYLLLFAVLLPHDSIWISDEGNRILTTRTYAETGTAYLPDSLSGLKQVPEEGLRAYPPPYFIQEKDGKWRSGYTAFFPWTSAFFYRAAGQFGLFLIPLAGGLLSILFTGLTARDIGLDSSKAALAMLLCAFATPFLFYSGVFLETTTAAFFATLGLWLAVKAAGSSKEQLLLFCCGLAVGTSTLFREEGFILTAAIILALAISGFSWKSLTAFSFGALLIILPLLIFNWCDSGSVFGMHAVVYSGLGTVRKYPLWIAKLRDYSMYLTLLCMPLPLLNSLPSLLLCAGGIFCALRKTAKIAEFIFYPLLVILCLFSCIYNIAANKDGLFVYQSLLDHLPFTAACIFSIPFLFRNADRKIRFLAYSAAFVILAVPLMLNEEHLGIFWGGRHFMNVIPTICILTASLFSSSLISHTAKYGTAALICTAVAASLTGYGVLFAKKSFSQEIVGTLNNPEVKTIVTDVFWLPEELAWLPRGTRVIFMTKEDSLEQVAVLCHANGIREFYAVLGLYHRVLSNESIARVFRAYRLSAGPLFQKERLKIFTVQIFHIALPDPPPETRNS